MRPGRSAGTRLVRHDTLDSTSSEALRRARAGEAGPLWVMAGGQTAGRGRRGRTWESASGNLHASLLLRDAAPPAQIAELAFVAALAVHDAIVATAPEIAARVTLKWPNDALLDGRKFAGILIESDGAAVVIGIGVDCAHHPDETATPATDLAAAGVTVAADELMASLSAAMELRLAQWQRGAEFAAIRADWLARAAGLGELVRIAQSGGERCGRFETLDDMGRLMLRLDDGRAEAISAGDVFTAHSARPLAAAARA